MIFEVDSLLYIYNTMQWTSSPSWKEYQLRMKESKKSNVVALVQNNLLFVTSKQLTEISLNCLILLDGYNINTVYLYLQVNGLLSKCFFGVTTCFGKKICTILFRFGWGGGRSKWSSWRRSQKKCWFLYLFLSQI